jgi:hypothetical protein
MRSIPLAFYAIRELGLGSMTAYALYELQRRTGWLRLRTPVREWTAVKLERLVSDGVPTDPVAYLLFRLGTKRSFFFDPLADQSMSLQRSLHGNGEALLAEADEILAGQFRFFGGPPIQYDSPPDWHKFPISEGDSYPEAIDLDVHWTKLKPDDFPLDIKLLWEPSRFGWAFILGRAYRFSRKDKYAQGFWQLFESWREQNPPNRGPHWISAQEVAIRLMALVFSLYAFHPYLSEDPKRIVMLMETIAAHAERIPPTILYSRAQGNNHLIIEAVGLYTTGLLFPELKHADRWHAEGRRWFKNALLGQIFTDGGYVQHSNNYHRLVLQAALWACRLAQSNNEGFSAEVLRALGRAASCVGSMVGVESGYVPNFGSNDGALLLPLTTCSFQDYRPVIQLAYRYLSVEEPFIAGAWDEASFWFGLSQEKGDLSAIEEKLTSGSMSRLEGEGSGTDVLKTSSLESFKDISMERRSYPKAGIYLLQGDETWGMFRCARFSNRPGHSDQLHLDLWWRGENIGLDPGTYLYNGAPPWQNGLAPAYVHNTTVVDGKEPMLRAGRFLWLKWAQGTLIRHKGSTDGTLEYICGEHDGYASMGLRVLRSIIRGGDSIWMIVDDLIGSGEHTLRCSWLLPDTSWEKGEASLRLHLPQGQVMVHFDSPITHWGLYRAGLLIAGEDHTEGAETLGWFSPIYSIKQPALHYTATITGTLPLRLISLWCLGDVDPERLQVEWEGKVPGQTTISTIRYDQAKLDL